MKNDSQPKRLVHRWLFELPIGALWLLVVALLVLPPSAWAHRASDAFLDVRNAPAADPIANITFVQPAKIQLQLSVALSDLDAAVPIDANADARITWGEVDTAANAMVAWIQSGTQLRNCELIWHFAGLERRGDRAHAVFSANPACTSAQAVVLQYALFKDLDATHRLIVGGRLDGQDLLAAASPTQREGVVLRAARTDVSAGSAPRSAWQTVGDYLGLGAHHLLEGVDHMAFLLALVLPLRLSLRRRSRDAACSVPRAQRQRGPWASLLFTVTAFTVGHSMTLGLVALGAIGPPPPWVEPMIAVSIGVSALLNIYPVRAIRGEYLALAFGLIHGLAFAGLLLDAAAPPGLLLWALAGFNLGVEAGQLLAVLVWVLLSQSVAHRPEYKRWVVPVVSWLLVGLSVFWFWQRVSA